MSQSRTVVIATLRMLWGALRPQVLDLAIIRVPREEDRAWKPVTALKASSPKKACQGWDMDLSEDKAEVDMAIGCTPQLRTHSMDVRGLWEFLDWSKGY